MASSEAKKTGSSLYWKLYPLAWCAIGSSAAFYIWASPSFGMLRAQIETDPIVVQRQMADARARVTALDKQNAQLREQLSASRSETSQLEARVANLAEDLRRANARSVTPSSSNALAPATAVTTTVPVSSAQPEAAAKPRPAAVSESPPIEIVNAKPANPPGPRDASPTDAPTTLAAAPAVTPRADPNAPPLPARVPQQQRVAALNRVNSGFTTSTTPQTSTTPATPITTGSVQTTAIPTTPAPSAAAATPQPASVTPDAAALRLSTAPSLDSLRLSWRVLNERHGSILQGLTPRYREVTGGAAGTTYQLIAGPLLSRGEAIQLCAMLQVRSVGCGVDSYEGSNQL